MVILQGLWCFGIFLKLYYFGYFFIEGLLLFTVKKPQQKHKLSKPIPVTKNFHLSQDISKQEYFF